MRKTVLTVAGFLLTILMAGAALAQPAQPQAQSPAAAAALVKLLDAKGLQNVAARDPSDPKRFIAALYIPGIQLLVVSASYPVPAALDPFLKDGKYRDVYLDLQGPNVAAGRLLVQDIEADGLKPSVPVDAPFDSVVENGNAETRFDGDFAGQKLSQEEYQSRFTSIDDRYTKMLNVLAGVLRARP